MQFTKGNRPLLLGHRGARGEKSVAENTFAAFDWALAHGCDGFEFDVRLSGDGQAVICHDARAKGIEVAAQAVAESGLPLLADLLKRYEKTAFLDIELKVPRLEKLALDLLREHRPARGWVISSFLPDVLRTVHGMDADIPLGLICETRSEFAVWPELPVQYVIPHHTLLGKSVTLEIQSAGNRVFVWTVNSETDMRRFVEWGVDGIISDHPEQLVRVCRDSF